MKGKSDTVIYKNPHGYAAWPDINILQNGEWIIAFCEAMARPQLVHRDPTFLPMLIRSTDQGETWDRFPQIIGGYEYYGMDDPGLVQLSNGHLLVNALDFLYVSRDTAERVPAYSNWLRHDFYPWAYRHGDTLVFRSTDNGHTWQKPIEVDVSPFNSGCTLRPILELTDGTLLLACYDETQEPCPSFVVRSEDGGKSWFGATTIAEDQVVQFYEPALIQTPNGKIIAMLRTHEEGDNFLYQCDSFDGGRTWTPPKRTPMNGYPAHLLTLQNGRILCVYGRRWPPFGIRACLSSDEGETWEIDDEIILRDDFPNGDLGYPTSAQLSDGSIVTAYYGQDADGITCLWLTRYEL